MADKRSAVQFKKGGLLGQGGFAKCYKVTDAQGTPYAAKVVSKQSLKSSKAKQKLFAEIKIHQAMRHKHIVRFYHVFEDAENVYMILELCENKSFVDMLKKRKKLTEPEVQYYMLQLLDALQYMERKRIIHRDLKLGNLFLSADMDLKIGDFGLAAMLKDDDELRRTICGTPNYIAPEVLFDQKTGHSYQVDIWSMGVIMYTLLVGRPPFQTKDVKAIYKKIRDNDYTFPEGCTISPPARDLITSILVRNPTARPSLIDIGSHKWFTSASVPKTIPLSALTMAPVLAVKSMSTRERVPLMPKVDVVNTPKKSGTAKVVKEMKEVKMETVKKVEGKENVDTVVKKQRPVGAVKENVGPNKSEKLVPKPANVAKKVDPVKKVGAVAVVHNKNVIKDVGPVKQNPQTTVVSPQALTSPNRRRTLMEVMYVNLENAMNAYKNGTISSVPVIGGKEVIQPPRVFISTWIDYSNKYGLGYQLTNGHVGVHFNDSTSMILSADNMHFEYLEYARGSDNTVMNRLAHTVSTYPTTLKKKVTLLMHFKDYMHTNLSRIPAFSFEDTKRTSNMDFLIKYLRTKHAVMFRLTNRVIQINFYDHTKLLLSHDGQVVTYINRTKDITCLSLSDVFIQQKADIVSRLKYARDVLASLTKRQYPSNEREGEGEKVELKTPKTPRDGKIRV